MKTYRKEDIIEFGKYKGRTIKYIEMRDPSYIKWCEKEIIGFIK